MGAKVKIEHISQGWMDIFKSGDMQTVVDAAGQRIASEAGEHFNYSQGQNNQYTAAGFVSSDEYTGDYQEATDKVLTKAVHA